MEFETADISHTAQWFSQRLGFDATLPDLRKLGLALLGGRKCRLGKIDAAYLFCISDGQRAFLFLIDPEDIGFALTGGRECSTQANSYRVTVWKEAGIVCVLVF